MQKLNILVSLKLVSQTPSTLIGSCMAVNLKCIYNELLFYSLRQNLGSCSSPIASSWSRIQDIFDITLEFLLKMIYIV